MVIVHMICSEFNEWSSHFLRWIPGKIGSLIRYYFYKALLAGCGSNVSIPVGCQLRDFGNIVLGSNINLGLYTQIYAFGTGEERVAIGDHVNLNSNVMINACMAGQIEIGNFCIIGPNVVFRTSNHIFADKFISVQKQGHEPGTIILQDDVWIGANASLIGNIRIGRGAVIGAGAVVIRDVSDFEVVAGVPARKIGAR
jgi:galactoside O-acetyltransferase